MIRRLLTAAVLALAVSACGPIDESDLQGDLTGLVQQGLDSNQAVTSTQDPVPVHPAVAVAMVGDPSDPQMIFVMAPSAPSNPGDAVSGTQDPIPVKGSPGMLADPSTSANPADPTDHRHAK